MLALRLIRVIFLSFPCTATLLTGCASVSGSSTQSLAIRTINGIQEIKGASCKLSNDVGAWSVTTPDEVVVKKSTQDLIVECSKADVGVGSKHIASSANSGAWGNLLLGGVIGYVADRNGGAGFNYPPSITVILQRIDNALNTK